MEAQLKALAEPRRRRILRLVRDKELTAGRIAAHFDVTREAISHHLRILHDSGLLAERREGTRRFYRSRPEGMAELQAFLDDFWGGRLERLKDEAERRDRKTRKRGR
jgi:DNA-binding transcriptional ArsR family regulator